MGTISYPELRNPLLYLLLSKGSGVQHYYSINHKKKFNASFVFLPLQERLGGINQCYKMGRRCVFSHKLTSSVTTISSIKFALYRGAIPSMWR